MNREVGVAINLVDGRFIITKGDVMFDSSEGILTILLEDGTVRVLNFDHVIDYTTLTQADIDRIFSDEEDDDNF